MAPHDVRTGLHLRHFLDLLLGVLVVAAYLTGWVQCVWGATALSALLLAVPRLAGLSRRPPRTDGRTPLPPPQSIGAYRFDQASRVVLFVLGIGLLASEHPIGWLPILAVGSTAILHGTTGFAVTLLVYSYTRSMWMRIVGQPSEAVACTTDVGNPDCVVCRTLGMAPYERCRWCSQNTIRWCCGLQTSLLLLALLIIAFLLNTALAVWVTKLLVTLSIVGVVALGLTIKWQTVDLIRALDDSADKRALQERRCGYLAELSLSDSIESAADTAVRYVCQELGARRVSVMMVEGEVLRIVASRGIRPEVVSQVAVPASERICGTVFATGRAVVFDDVAAQEPALALGLAARGAAVSLPLIAAPMRSGGRKVGCINATDLPRERFSGADIEELEFAAEAAAISLAAQMARHEVEQANYDTIRALAQAVEAKDPYTHGHSVRVQAWSVGLGREMGLDETRLRVLGAAAELHDIGKLAVPDEILKGARPLTDREWSLVREHPVRGVQMIEHLRFLAPAIPAVRHHHERFGGGGYPDGLIDEQIPLEARIMCVVDAYDAMTSARPYRRAMAHEEAAAELRRCAAAQFDPGCVEVFLKMLGDEREAMGGLEEALAASAPIGIKPNGPG